MKRYLATFGPTKEQKRHHWVTGAACTKTIHAYSLAQAETLARLSEPPWGQVLSKVDFLTTHTWIPLSFRFVREVRCGPSK